MGLFKKTIDFDSVSTKGGDTGKSSSFSGEFLYKDSTFFQVIGTIDEVQSYIGIVKNLVGNEKTLTQIQKDLYNAMAVIATDCDSENYKYIKALTEDNVYFIEKKQKKLLDDLQLEYKFVIPGDDGISSAYYDYLRTLVRRAERELVGYIKEKHKPFKVDYEDLKIIQKYLNRLSDFFFVWARAV